MSTLLFFVTSWRALELLFLFFFLPSALFLSSDYQTGPTLSLLVYSYEAGKRPCPILFTHDGPPPPPV